MVAYARDEMIDITELSKSLGKYLDKIIVNQLNKIVIIRKNKPEAVILSVSEFEQLKNARETLKNMKEKIN